MKISNLKQIKIIGFAITTLNLVVITGFFMLENLFWKFVCLLFSVILLLIIINLRSIEIENSGECFSLKERHPFAEKKYVPSKLEFPLSSIDELNIQEGLFVHYMYIKIRKDDSERKLRISLPLFTKHQILYTRKLLEKNT